MLEKTAHEYLDFIGELLTQQISGHRFGAKILGSAEESMVLLVGDSNIPNFQKALSLLASATGEVGRIGIPYGTSGISIIKSKVCATEFPCILLTDQIFHDVFWSGEIFTETDTHEANTFHPGCVRFLNPSIGIKVSTFGLKVGTSGDCLQLMIFDGFSGLYTAREFMVSCINLESVEGVSLVDLSTAPKAHCENFSGKFMVILSKRIY